LNRIVRSARAASSQGRVRATEIPKFLRSQLALCMVRLPVEVEFDLHDSISARTAQGGAGNVRQEPQGRALPNLEGSPSRRLRPAPRPPSAYRRPETWRRSAARARARVAPTSTALISKAPNQPGISESQMPGFG
jgi:hypothetical protein